MVTGSKLLSEQHEEDLFIREWIMKRLVWKTEPPVYYRSWSS